MLKKVVSGGQTGADQAGLAVAKMFAFETGGFAPKGYMTKSGPNEILLRYRYGLRESTGDYKQRTWENVKNSDGTIRLAISLGTPGELCTLNAIKQYKKSYIDVNLLKPIPTMECFDWIVLHQIEVLNVAGNTQNTYGYDIYTMTFGYLGKLFRMLKGE